MTRIAATRVGSRPALVQFPTEPSADDIDWIAVERVVAVDRPLPELNPAEKRIAALLLAKTSRTEEEISVLVGVTARQVSRWKREEGPMKRRCSLDDCDRPVRAAGLCNRHYHQEQRRRQPRPAKGQRTTCRAGLHAYPDCLATRPNGRPYCQPCDNAARKAYRERQAAARKNVATLSQSLGRQQLGEAA